MLYFIKGEVTIPVKTIVEASTAEEAKQKIDGRELMLCIHGTDNDDCHDSWVYNYLEFCDDLPDVHIIEPYENDE